MKSAFLMGKNKTVALLIILVATVSLAVSGTLAFFTDYRQSTGVFTVGTVYIELTESAVVADSTGNLVPDTTRDRIYGAELNSAQPVIHNYGYVFPGQVICKDPIVKNVGTENAWVAVKVIFEDGAGDIHRLFGYSDDSSDIDIEHILEGGLLAEDVRVGEWNGIADVCYNDNYAMIQSSNRSKGKYEFYFLFLKPLESGESVQVFESLFFDSEFGNPEMLEFRELKVVVQAFAAQQYGFSSCYDAMTTAFDDHFAGCVPKQ